MKLFLQDLKNSVARRMPDTDELPAGILFSLVTIVGGAGMAITGAVIDSYPVLAAGAGLWVLGAFDGEGDPFD